MLHCSTRSLADVPASDDWLSPGERAVLAGLRFAKRRDDWLLGRWTARQALCRYFGLAPEVSVLSSFEIRAAPDGAPEVFVQGQRRPVSLSISHSEAVGFCAAGPQDAAVGCDIEHVRPLVDYFVEDYFAPEEEALLENVAGEERPPLALLIWSAKESALKSLREGLRRDTRSVVVSVDFRAAAVGWKPLVVRCTQTTRTFHGWWRMENGFVKTVTAALNVPINMV